MLNLLIAILSNTYSVLEPRSRALFSIEIAKLNNTMGWDPKYGALVTAPPLIDLILLPFVPFFVIMNDPTRLNDALTLTCFLPVMAAYLIVTLVLDLMLGPLVWLVSLATKARLVCVNKTERKNLLLDLLFYAATGLFLEIASSFLQVPRKARELLSTNLRKKNAP